MIAKQMKIPALDLATGWMTVAALLVLPALYVELTGDFPGRVWFYGQEEDSWMAGLFLDAHAVMVANFVTVFQMIGNTLQGIQNFFA